MLNFEILVQYGSMILHSELLQNQEELQHHWCAGTDFRCFTTSHPSWPLLLTVPFSCNKAVLYCIRRLLTCFCFKFNEVRKRVSMKTPFVSMNQASPTRPNLSRSFQNLPSLHQSALKSSAHNARARHSALHCVGITKKWHCRYCQSSLAKKLYSKLWLVAGNDLCIVGAHRCVWCLLMIIDGIYDVGSWSRFLLILSDTIKASPGGPSWLQDPTLECLIWGDLRFQQGLYGPFSIKSIGEQNILVSTFQHSLLTSRI